MDERQGLPVPPPQRGWRAVREVVRVAGLILFSTLMRQVRSSKRPVNQADQIADTQILAGGFGILLIIFLLVIGLIRLVGWFWGVAGA